MSTPLDQIKSRLAALQALSDAATPGPWETDAGCVIFRSEESGPWLRAAVDGGYYGVVCESGEADDGRSLDLIAASRNELPKLLDALEAAVDAIEDSTETGVTEALEAIAAKL